ncbi:MAG: peroxidase [Candidatus Dormibacteraeota bacterium]|nr:peroxidase [Candidatus Dormibacteraeota bacterium]
MTSSDGKERNETDGAERRDRGSSRRAFLRGAGLTGAGLVAGSVGTAAELARPGGAVTVAAIPDAQPGVPASSMDFGRIFPNLPSFAPANNVVRQALLEVGRQGGIMDAQDQLSAGPTRLITDPTVNGNPTATNAYGTNPDNVTMTAGSTFFGQFVDHDITLDQTSKLGVPQNPLISPDTRTPALDLDSVFGGGPGTRPDLYVDNADGSVGPKLKIGSGGVHEDVPRVANGDGTFSALLGDPRNDEQMMTSGMHAGHILFYNRVLDELAGMDLTGFPTGKLSGTTGHVAFLKARQVTQWHYQWLVVNEHLPQIAGQALVNDVLKNGNRFYKPPAGNAFMPIEFAGACYRFGHSQVRPSYRANFTSGTGDSTSPTADPFFGLVFDANIPQSAQNPSFDRDDLDGGFPAPRRYIGWQTFFDLGDGQVKTNKKIDPTISSVLFTLPIPAIAPKTQQSPTVLPQRNLLRQLTWTLPSGQSVARAMGVTPLGRAELSDIAGVYAPFGTSTPLWYYILAEAKATTDGITLGPVGGRIVTETLIGLMRADPNSYLAAKPGFTPFLGTDLQLGPTPVTTIAGNRTYTHSHFLWYAGAVAPGIYR